MVLKKITNFSKFREVYINLAWKALEPELDWGPHK
jgi:hypothetical protein